MTAQPRAFVWPPAVTPRAVPQASPPPPQQPQPPTLRANLARGWHHFERAWLAPVALPLRHRIELAQWRPDAPGDYCERCAHDVGPAEADEFGCAHCRARRFPWSRSVRLGSYQDDLALWIQEAKFARNRRLAIDLGRLLGIAARDAGFLRDAAAAGRPPLVIPMPTTLRRRVARGIDHAGLIASGAARELGLRTSQPLTRHHRPSQRSVAPSQRASNVAGSFTCRCPARIAGRDLLLIDDVTTTGATLRAAARALLRAQRAQKPAQTRIWIAVLGVTPQPGRRPGGANEPDSGPPGL